MFERDTTQSSLEHIQKSYNIEGAACEGTPVLIRWNMKNPKTRKARVQCTHSARVFVPKKQNTHLLTQPLNTHTHTHIHNVTCTDTHHWRELELSPFLCRQIIQFPQGIQMHATYVYIMRTCCLPRMQKDRHTSPECVFANAVCITGNSAACIPTQA